MNMMKMMAINDSKTGIGGNMMKVMGRYDRLIGKFINALYWENNTDMYIKRYIGLFNTNHSHSQVLEDKNQKGGT